MDAYNRCTNLGKKTLPIELPSMIEAEKFSDHPRMFQKKILVFFIQNNLLGFYKLFYYYSWHFMVLRNKQPVCIGNIFQYLSKFKWSQLITKIETSLYLGGARET
jgi:hypothetical protein